MKITSKTVVACPECDSDVRLKKVPHLGKIITCPDCGARLEVTNVAPIELDWATQYQFKENFLDKGNKRKKRRKSRRAFEYEWDY